MGRGGTLVLYPPEYLLYLDPLTIKQAISIFLCIADSMYHLLAKESLRAISSARL